MPHRSEDFRRLRRAVSMDAELRWGDLSDEEHKFLEPLVLRVRGQAIDQLEVEIERFLERQQADWQYAHQEELDARILHDEVVEAEVDLDTDRYDDQMWVNQAGDWAEINRGLDPIGASDMLSDFTRFASKRLREKGRVPYTALWEEFKESEAYARYHMNESTPWAEHYGRGSVATVEVPRRWVQEVVSALDKAKQTGDRRLPDAQFANHQRLIQEARFWQ